MPKGWQGHKWVEIDEGGDIDYMAMHSEQHNGPACENCGLTFCEHCQDWRDLPLCKEENPS